MLLQFDRKIKKYIVVPQTIRLNTMQEILLDITTVHETVLVVWIIPSTVKLAEQYFLLCDTSWKNKLNYNLLTKGGGVEQLEGGVKQKDSLWN